MLLDTHAAPFRIAVIDDDAVFLELMQDLLGASEGYEVVVCAKWAAAFEFVKHTQPDLIMLDLMLGREQTGWAVLELLRSDPATCQTPVILCSAAVPALNATAARINGHIAVEAVPKPFDVDHLLNTIARLLATTGKTLA
jgi:CheY-like chemotaxis protein